MSFLGSPYIRLDDGSSEPPLGEGRLDMRHYANLISSLDPDGLLKHIPLRLFNPEGPGCKSSELLKIVSLHSSPDTETSGYCDFLTRHKWLFICTFSASLIGAVLPVYKFFADGFFRLAREDDYLSVDEKLSKGATDDDHLLAQAVDHVGRATDVQTGEIYQTALSALPSNWLSIIQFGMAIGIYLDWYGKEENHDDFLHIVQYKLGADLERNSRYVFLSLIVYLRWLVSEKHIQSIASLFEGLIGGSKLYSYQWDKVLKTVSPHWLSILLLTVGMEMKRFDLKMSSFWSSHRNILFKALAISAEKSPSLAGVMKSIGESWQRELYRIQRWKTPLPPSLEQLVNDPDPHPLQTMRVTLISDNRDSSLVGGLAAV